MEAEYEFLYKEIFLFNSYNCEEGEMKDRVVIDIGANTGYFAIYAIENGAKKVYAFEPNKNNFVKLLERTKDFDNIICINKAVHKEGVTKCYTVNDSNPNLTDYENGVRCEVRVAEKEEQGTVDCISLKEILDGINERVILKTDCEGSEYDFFLSSSKETLQKIDLIYSELHDKIHPNHEYNTEMLTDFIVKNGFEYIKCQIRWSTGVWIGDHYIPERSDKNGDNNYYRKFKRLQNVNVIPEYKPKIYDCFPIFNELDLLEIRLEELNSVVDKFIITEANATHQGNPKPLYLTQNMSRFEKYKDKIEIIYVDLLSNIPDPTSKQDWTRERFQRNKAYDYLKSVCSPSDIIIVSDADEIPRVEAINKYISDKKDAVGVLLQDRFMYYLNYKNISTDEPQLNSKILRFEMFNKYNYQELTAMRYADAEKLMPTYTIPNGGWHFTFQGGLQKVIEKVKSFAHREYTVPEKINYERMLKNFEEGIDVYDAKTTWERIDVDDTFPKIIKNNKQKYIDNGWIKEPKQKTINEKVMIDKKNILCSISTKGRYDTTLAMAIQSVLSQTLLPDAIHIYDDNNEPKDLREIQHYHYLFRMLDEKNVSWKIIFGQRKGQHYNHQLANTSGYNWVWRLDDDTVAEPNVLKTLYEATDDTIGAVGGSILTPPFEKGIKATGKIENIKVEPNLQWDYIKETKEVDHLHCSFLYRAGVLDYDLSLSRVCHREESVFTFGLKNKGYKILIVPCVTWHLRNSQGGIRDKDNTAFMYEHDERIFDSYLKLWNVNSDSKLCVIDAGIGDHYAFKNIIPLLLKKYKRLTIAVCFPNVFFDEDKENIDFISIEQSKKIFSGDIGVFNIYAWMDKNKWNKSLTEAFKEFYKV
jgi:beta-1,4-mannosyl-glycoprotein beta-1,4-N-acetylglucosaminyltransferase